VNAVLVVGVPSTRPERPASSPAKRLALPSLAASSSRWPGKETLPANPATDSRCAESIPQSGTFQHFAVVGPRPPIARALGPSGEQGLDLLPRGGRSRPRAHCPEFLEKFSHLDKNRCILRAPNGPPKRCPSHIAAQSGSNSSWRTPRLRFLPRDVHHA